MQARLQQPTRKVDREGAERGRKKRVINKERSFYFKGFERVGLFSCFI